MVRVSSSLWEKEERGKMRLIKLGIKQRLRERE